MNDKPADGLGTQLRRLLELLDGDLETLYREEHPDYVPRYTPVMKALAAGGSMTIKAIAERSSISHSAASQTISKMSKLGLVVADVEGDRRSRSIRLSQEGLNLLPWLEAHWQATQAAANELDWQLSTPLSQLLAEAIMQLEAQSFYERIRSHHKDEGETPQ